MTDLHKAIRAIHDNVVTINGDSKTNIVAVDASGNDVTINWTDVEAWTDPDAYKIKRQIEYPSVQDQLDMQYWDNVNSTTTWKDTIAKVKSDNPKG